MLNRLQEKRNEGGFTLIELLIVIVILAILAAISYSPSERPRTTRGPSCKADAKSVETAVEAYKAQLSTFPPTGIAVVSSLAGSTTDGNGNQVDPGSASALEPQLRHHARGAVGATSE